MRNKTVWGKILALGLIASSLLYFLICQSEDFGKNMEFRVRDSADYRVLAEHFFGIPHDKLLYENYFIGDFSSYLDKVPFRGLLPGSYVLLLAKAVEWIYPSWGNYGPEFRILYASLLKLFLVITYYTFYVVCARRFGVMVGLFLLLPLVLPLSAWSFTEGLWLAEPMLRIAFVWMAIMLLSIERGTNTFFKYVLWVLILCVLAAHMKAQWFLLSFMMFAAALCAVGAYTISIKKLAVLAFVTLIAPASIFLVNIWGWDYYGISAGSSMHAQHKTDGDFMRTVCQQPVSDDISIFCNRNEDEVNGFWRVYVGKGTTKENFSALDKKSIPYFLDNIRWSLDDVKFALSQAQAFFDYDDRLKPVVHMLTYMTWAMLFIGMLHWKTVLPATLGLGLWVIPAWCNIFALFDIRYYTFTTGIPLMLAMIVTYEFYVLYRGKYAT